MAIVLDGNNLLTSGVLNSMTAQSASGTSVDFTGIPAGVKRVTVMYSGVSTSSTSPLLIQLGTSGGITTTGYNQGGWYSTAAGGYNNTTAGFALMGTSYSQASNGFHGSYVFSLLGNNIWAGQGLFYVTTNVYYCLCAGSVSLSGALTTIRNTTNNGTDTFDAGTINVLYE
jgi:hypothetical protein